MSKSQAVLAVGVVLVYTMQLSAGEPVLRVSGIPTKLVLPLPEGSNAVLTAIVQDGAPRSVWLATSKDAKLKYTFTKTAPSEYQANLAEPEVAGALKTEKGRGRFQVFAELDDGRVLASIGVGYTFRDEPASGPGRDRVEVLLKDKTKRRTTSLDDPFGPDAYFVPDDVVSIELAGEAAAARARAGRETFEFRQDGEQQPARLKLDDAIRKAWLDANELKVEYRHLDRWQPAATLRPRPIRLDFPGNIVSMIVYQRGTKEIPGSHGYLRIELGDITHGQAHLAVRTAESKSLIDTTSVRRGESVTLEYGGEQLVLHVRDLVNHLIGDDWAVIDLSRIADAELKKIERLLARIEASDVRFIREGQEYDGKQAAAHLRQRLSEAGPRLKTLDEFIEQLASRSSLSGKSYEIKLPDGKTVPANRWLRETAMKPESAEKLPKEPE